MWHVETKRSKDKTKNALVGMATWDGWTDKLSGEGEERRLRQRGKLLAVTVQVLLLIVLRW